MSLPLFIAKRYLFAKKSHNIINIISMISAIGIAIGTASLIIILSVYNGFEGLVKEMYSIHEPDIIITASKGKGFEANTIEFNSISNDPRIEAFCPIIQENVFVKYGNNQSVAVIKGVDSSYVQITPIKKRVKEGSFKLFHGEVPHAVLGREIAYNLGVRVHFLEPIYLYFPSRFAQISFVNPASKLNSERLFPSGIFTIDQNVDKQLIFIPIDVARELLEYDTEVTGIEIFTKDRNTSDLQKEIKELLGSDFQVKNRYEQNETLYKMMLSEKLSIYIILFFIIVIISCNLFGSLSMLIIEKREDSKILSAIGANDSTIKRIFVIEGWLISLLGIVSGVAFAIIFYLIQKYFGIISMPGNFIVDSYPIILKPMDVIFTVIGVALIGYVSAKLPLTIIKKIENF